jgi:hypothetical protein
MLQQPFYKKNFNHPRAKKSPEDNIIILKMTVKKRENLRLAEITKQTTRWHRKVKPHI